MATDRQPDPPGSGPLLDIAGVAHHLGVSVRHVRRLVAERRIPYLKWGHLLRFDAAEIEDWLHAARVPVQSFASGPASVGGGRSHDVNDRRDRDERRG